MPTGAFNDVPSSFVISYCGFTVLDFSTVSTATLRWVAAELLELLPLGKENVNLAIDENAEPMRVIGTQRTDSCGKELIVLEHSVACIRKFLRFPDNERAFAYLVRASPDFPFICHAFVAETEDHVGQIANLLSESAKRTRNITGNGSFQARQILDVLPANCGASSSSQQCSERIPVIEKSGLSSQFEVLYLCRVEVFGSPSSAIIDEAARRYDEEYRTTRAHSFLSASVRRLVEAGECARDDSLRTRLHFSEVVDDGPIDESESAEHRRNPGRRRSSILVDALVDSVFVDDGYSTSSPSVERKRSSLYGLNMGTSHSLADLVKTCANSNRSMLMSIGRQDICLISLTDKKRLLHKKLTEISSVVRGSKYEDHFAFVCPDPWHSGRLDCFVIRCQDASIADSIIRAMRAAFNAAFNEHASVGGRNHACDQCPLFQYSCLCSDVEGMQPRAIHDLIINRINRLSSPHQQIIWTGYKDLLKECGTVDEGIGDQDNENSKDSNSRDIRRKNTMLMSVLRSVCESAQILHAHSVEKLSNGHGDASTVPSTMSDAEIYLKSATNSADSKGTQNSSSGIDTLSSSSSYQRFSAVSKLVSLRDRAKDALGGSLDSFIKRKHNNNSNNNEEARIPLLKSNDGSVSSGEGNGKIVVPSLDDVDRERHTHNSRSMDYPQRENVQVRHGDETSPPTPSPPFMDNLTTLQATFHFETPGRRGSDGDLHLRPRSSTFGDVFILSGGSYERAVGAKRGTGDARPPLVKYDSRERSNCSLNMTQRGRRMSWRQAILNRVVSPRLHSSRHSVAGLALYHKDFPSETRRSSGISDASSPASLIDTSDETVARPAFYKSLWKKAIIEQILTVRLENQRKANDAETEEIRNLKLTYEEITPCSEDEIRPIWLSMLNHPKRNTTRFDRIQVEEAVKAGVPRDLRHEVWKFLLQQHQLDRTKRAHMETPKQHRYQDLLKELTSYQHAILIDLGRTFPSHSYFSQSLGAGQLSLFNILKAYSLFDNEVGYCQGLSFVAGVLLLHMEEEDAFGMLVDMMYRLQLRRQYRPDMMALQVEMYQLSRLLHDRHKDLHDHLEEHEIPILYAAPWFLTLFASAFPLGFVARVFDFVFFAGGLDVVFKIALILLGDHKELIKHCDSFESISDFLKTTLPSMSIIQMERVFNQVVELDVSRELLAYEVEYHVLQEEVLSSPIGPSPPMSTTLPVPRTSTGPDNQAYGTPADYVKLDTANRFLKRQNMELLEQLQQARHQLAAADKARTEMQAKLDATNGVISSYECKLNSLETRLDAMELERKSLLATVQKLRSSSVNGIEPHNAVQNGAPVYPRSKPA